MAKIVDASPEERELDPIPTVWVLGQMGGSHVALRFGWAHGMHPVSNSRFKFMREELKLNIIDDAEKYLF